MVGDIADEKLEIEAGTVIEKLPNGNYKVSYPGETGESEVIQKNWLLSDEEHKKAEEYFAEHDYSKHYSKHYGRA